MITLNLSEPLPPKRELMRSFVFTVAGAEFDVFCSLECAEAFTSNNKRLISRIEDLRLEREEIVAEFSDDASEPCQECGEHVMCRFHSLLSALERKTEVPATTVRRITTPSD